MDACRWGGTAAGPAAPGAAEPGDARLPAGTAGGLRPDLAGSKVPHEKENAKEKSTPDRCGDGGGFVMGVRRPVKNNAR